MEENVFAKAVVVEQLGNDKIAIDLDSLNTILNLVDILTMKLLVPKGTKPDDTRVKFMQSLLDMSGALIMLSLFKSDMFADLIEEHDIAEVRYNTVAESDVDKKLKEFMEGGGKLYS